MGRSWTKATFGTALEQFEPVWDSLNSREHVLIIRALIEAVDVHRREKSVG